eukprot:11302493-Prorocentrum_lima.AAC.1
MCAKYAKRQITRAGGFFEDVYPAVWEHYKVSGTWPMSEEDDFTDIEDETTKQTKRKAQEDVEADAHAHGSKTDANRKKRERARASKARQATQQAASSSSAAAPPGT